MQATGTFGRTRDGKRVLAIVVALLAALALGGAGAFVAKDLAAAPAASHSGAAALAQSVGGVDSYRAVRGGLQTGDDPAANSQSTAVTAKSNDCIRIDRGLTC
jgi:hypothetical protein